MNLHSSHQIPGSRFGEAKRLTLRTRGLAVAGLLNGSWREANPSVAPAREPGRQSRELGPQSDRQEYLSYSPALSEAELTEITPQLCRSGAGALAWSQLRDSALADSPAALELREVYRRQRLSALLHERQIAQVITLLRAEGIEPVLIKGWAIARRYPDRALRPYGDIDLCVRPDSHAHAARVLERIASLDGPFVDLHCGFTGIGQKKNGLGRKKNGLGRKKNGLGTLDFGLWRKDYDDWDELFHRSHVVWLNESKVQSPKSKVKSQLHPGSVGILPADFGPWTLDFGPSVPVRVLGDEDHLRLLCRHLLRSGAHRPLWLCDIALLIESLQSPQTKVQSPKSKVQRPASFDWDICLGRNPLDANWLGVVVGLAHELLGARIDETPFANQKLPAWLVPAVLEQWGGKRSGRWAVGSGQTEVQSVVQSPRSKVQSRGVVQSVVQSPRSKVQSHGVVQSVVQSPRSKVQSHGVVQSDGVVQSPRSKVQSDGVIQSHGVVQSDGVIQSPRSKVQSLHSADRLWTLDFGLWTSFLDFGRWTGLYHRWDNPIRSTAAVGGRFDERSRLPYRLLESAMRIVPEVRGQKSEVGDQRSNLGS